jgi:hypothetical protein
VDGGIILAQTLRKGNEHKHILYLNTLTGAGASSENKGHTHPITFDPMVGAWMVGEAEKHTHQIAEYTPKVTKKDEKDLDIVDDCIKLFKYARDYEKEARKKGQKSYDYYKGDQWDKKISDKLESESRAVITINEIESKVDLLSGYQRQNRTDFKFYPTEGGDQVIAEVLDIVTKNITENCNYRFEETDVFVDGVVPGRGVFNIYVDHSKNPQGDLKIERFQWDDVYFGPHNTKDLSDLEHLHKVKWFSKAKIAQMYPEKAKDIEEIFDDDDGKKGTVTDLPGDKYAQADNTKLEAHDPDLVDIGRKQIRLVETWRKEFNRAYVIVNTDDDFYYKAVGWAEDDINSIKTIPGIDIIPFVDHRMRVTQTAGDKLLADEYPDIPIQDFHIITFYGKKIGNDFMGKVRSAEGAQDEVNKRHSQLVDIMNRQAGYGWFYDSETFPSPQDAENFKKTSSTPGFVQKVQNLQKVPEKVEGAKVPTEIIQLLTIESSAIRNLMNINLEMEGNQSNAQSGVAIMERKKQGLVGNEFLFDNLSLAKAKIGRFIVAYIKKLYPADRIMRIIVNENKRQLAESKKPLQIGGQDFDDVMRQNIEKLLNTADLEQYDITISESGWSPTTRLANFYMWSEMANKGMPIPPEFLIELSDLPEKDKFLAFVNQQRRENQAIEKGKQQTEIAKTMIAKQGGAGATNGAL